MRLSIAVAKGTRSSFLVIPSTSLSPNRPSFLLRSLSHTLRLLSLNNGEPLPPPPLSPPPPPLFSLSSLHILLPWDAAHCLTLKCTPLAAATSFLRDLPESAARQIGDSGAFQLHSRRISSWIVRRAGPTIPLKRVREDVTE